MNIDDLTMKEVREIANFVSPAGRRKESPFVVGECYLIRTVTMCQVGRVKAVYDTELVLEDASWIADTGRFHSALKEGTFDEVEPFVEDVFVGRGAIVDATRWTHDLPREQK